MIKRVWNRAGRMLSGWRRRSTVARGQYGLVLNYHRVYPEPAADTYLLRVTPEHFDSQLAWLKRRFDIVPLHEITDFSGERPRVALTFDDGYADNLYHVLPILERHRVVATVFVTTGAIDNPKGFWWDELERIVLLSKDFPGRFVLHAQRMRREFTVTNDIERRNAHDDLSTWLFPLAPGDKREILAQLEEIFFDHPASDPIHRSLNEDELRKLAASPSIAIGGHTVNHVCLARRPFDEQVFEIEKSLEVLRDIVGRAVDSFSYPYGGKRDIGPDAPRLVAKSGCTLARANWPGIVTKRSDRFLLPGLLVRNWDVVSFGQRISSYLQGSTYRAV